VTINRLNLAPRTQFIINIAMALALLSVIFLALWAQFYR
jgi:hypothetical protein